MDFCNYCLLFSVLQAIAKMATSISIHIQPREIVLNVGEDKTVQFYTT